MVEQFIGSQSSEDHSGIISNPKPSLFIYTSSCTKKSEIEQEKLNEQQ